MARTQLASKRSYDPEIEATLILLEARRRGDIVTYLELEQTIKTTRHDDNAVWYIVLARAKDKFLKRTGIAIRCVKNVGYKLLTAEDQLNDMSHERSAARKIRKGGTEKSLIHSTELSEAEQNRRAAIVHQTSMTINLMRKHDAEKKSFLASTEAVNIYNRFNSVNPVATVNRINDPRRSEPEQQQP